MDAKQAAALLGGWDNILILTHKRPDGDTIGSALGLCALLRQLGKTAYLLPNEDATPIFQAYLEGHTAPADFVHHYTVAVDVASPSLLTPRGFAQCEAGIDLVLDHHPSNDLFGKHNCVVAAYAACGELIYDLVGILGTLTPEIATPLYLAVSTDTGCFVYGNTTAHTHSVAAALMEGGAVSRPINKRHFRTKSWKRLRLEGAIVDNLQLHHDGRIALAPVTLAMMEAIGARESDAEDIAAFVGQIEGVAISATIRELSPTETKISLRSTPEILNASATCALLGGGGHVAAAGCTVAGDAQTATAAILAAIEQVLHG